MSMPCGGGCGCGLDHFFLKSKQNFLPLPLLFLQRPLAKIKTWEAWAG
ncbi:MAG: hypothetical protein ACK53X_05110 [Holosporales bacterium]